MSRARPCPRAQRSPPPPCRAAPRLHACPLARAPFRCRTSSRTCSRTCATSAPSSAPSPTRASTLPRPQAAFTSALPIAARARARRWPCAAAGTRASSSPRPICQQSPSRRRGGRRAPWPSERASSSPRPACPQALSRRRAARRAPRPSERAALRSGRPTRSARGRARAIRARSAEARTGNCTISQVGRGAPPPPVLRRALRGGRVRTASVSSSPRPPRARLRSKGQASMKGDAGHTGATPCAHQELWDSTGGSAGRSRACGVRGRSPARSQCARPKPGPLRRVPVLAAVPLAGGRWPSSLRAFRGVLVARLIGEAPRVMSNDDNDNTES